MKTKYRKWKWLLLGALLVACGGNNTDSTLEELPAMEGFAVRFLDTSFETAQALARANNKALLVDFYADW